ncbi:FAD-binding protein [Denitrobaculum tricleocarpae]|uniref:FAD-binding protein n=1 Tax=Denitrobaculum tricleocarpae TaxID=2591009 RepID=A0A545TWR8_9PROT|nr:FAD-binding protein [Denitrobaculum tricleocarpae]TQV81658.1 FAD-binding protein [Denitrobaculum tricleocarpae]
MGDRFKPDSIEQVGEIVSWAAAENTPIEVLGRGSKAVLGRPTQTEYSLDLSALTGITLYEPDELVLSAKAGTPMAEIEAALAEQNQYLAFEPADYGPLLSGLARERGPSGSLGGVVSCNLAGPRRIKSGAARDHFLGLKGISGRGEIFQAGGRVVKNVTGYDLMKLHAGAYGTLSALTDVTVKVLPAPEKTRSVLLFGLDDAQAVIAMTQAMGSSHEVSAAAHLPAAVAQDFGSSHFPDAQSVTAIRVEGPGPSVKHRCAALRKELSGQAETEELHSHNSLSLWAFIRDVIPFALTDQDLSIERDAVWRISLPPARGADYITCLKTSLGEHAASVKYFFDWSGGLIWLALPEQDEARHEAVRNALAPFGGHATLIRASADLRNRIAVFQPLDLGIAALSSRVKKSFDPHGIMNPGRMYAGV